MRTSRCVPPVPGRTPSENFRQSHLARVARRDADVGRHRHFEAAADAVAVYDVRDDEFRRLLPAATGFRSRCKAEMYLNVGVTLCSTDIRAASENFSRAGP